MKNLKSLKKWFVLSLCFLFAAFSSVITNAMNPDDQNDNSSNLEKFATCRLVGITIKKVDSITLAGLGNAEFELSNNSQFKGTCFTLKTNQDGIAAKSSLMPGKWYLREKVAPKGYIKYTETIEVLLNKNMKAIILKNTPYGKINILKKDPENRAVSGAVFTIYKGENPDPEKIFKDDLVSNEQGEVLVNDVEPGLYTMIEKQEAPGYHKNDTPITKEVIAGQTTIFEMENIKIQKGTLKLYKKDAETKEQLAGSKIGIYSDAEFKSLITTVETSDESAAIVENLDPGTYYVKEHEAPEGYLLDAPSQEVVLEEGSTVEVVFENSKDIPTAGNFGSKLVIGLSLFAISSIIAVLGKIYLRKKYNVT